MRSTKDEIVVVATRFRGQVDAPQPPIITLNEEDIAAYGAGSLDELITLLAPETGSGRGRGDGRPVFLLNGQRVSSFREMRDILPEAIRRVEVLPEEVALRYGYPPNQRVVNFILKDNFASKTLAGEYDVPTLGGFSEQELEGSLLRIDGPRRFNLAAKFNATSMLTEADRDVIQSRGSVPTVATDPDPAACRSLIASNRTSVLNGTWSTGLGDKGAGGSLSLNGTYTHADTRGFSGLDTVFLTAPGGATATRSLDDPLALVTHQDTVQAGATLNKTLGGWQLTATLDAGYDATESRNDRRADVTGLVAAAAAGTLPITGPLPGVVDAGSDLARSRSLTGTSLVTLAGSPFRLPAGAASLAAKMGYAYANTRSSDTRTALDALTLKRGDLSAGLNLALPITSRRENVLSAIGDVTLNLSAGLDRLSDFGTLTDWSAGVTWNPTAKLGLQASYIVNAAAPSLAQLGAPTIETFNVPVYDFSRSEAALVTVITGGNPDLLKEKQRDLKISANWQLPFLSRSNLVVEYFRNRSNDVTQSFPLLTPAIEAAFPTRVARDVPLPGETIGRLRSIDRSPVTFSEIASSRLRWGLNLSGAIGQDAQGGPDGPGGGFGGPPGSGGGGRGPGGGMGGPGGGMGGPGGGGGPPPGFMGRGNPRGGRWNIAVYHTYNFTNTVMVAPGGPVLDLLNGDAITAGGMARHQLEFEGGGFYKGVGLRLNGTWNAPVDVRASGALGSSDLRFGSVFDIDMRLFADLGRVPGLADKNPFFKGARLTLKVNNLLGSRQRVTDGSGAVPLAYQSDFIDPRGRVIGFDFRKLF